MNLDLTSYYSERAREYEKIYEKPERQDDLQKITLLLKDIFSGRELMEVACGTGYWTEKIAQTAREIHATDINNTVLKIAKAKDYHDTKVTFRAADFNKIKPHGNHESLFGGFIWSHIKLQELDEFVDLMISQVAPGGELVFVDNNYVKGSSTPVAFKDESGNTYQKRILENKKEFLVLKNFPSEKFLRKLLKHKSTEIKFTSLKYYWILIFKNG